MSSYDDDDDDGGDDENYLNLLLKSGDNLFLANPKSPLRGFSGDFFFKSSPDADCQGFFALFASPLILSQTSDITFSFPFLFWCVSKASSFSNIIRPPPLLDYAILPIIMQFSYQLHIS